MQALVFEASDHSPKLDSQRFVTDLTSTCRECFTLTISGSDFQSFSLTSSICEKHLMIRLPFSYQKHCLATEVYSLNIPQSMNRELYCQATQRNLNIKQPDGENRMENDATPSPDARVAPKHTRSTLCIE
jgi:hypothetical protein